MVVIVPKDLVCHIFIAFGAAHKVELGAAGIKNDSVFELLLLAGEAGLMTIFDRMVLRDRLTHTENSPPSISEGLLLGRDAVLGEKIACQAEIYEHEIFYWRKSISSMSKVSSPPGLPAPGFSP